MKFLDVVQRFTLRPLNTDVIVMVGDPDENGVSTLVWTEMEMKDGIFTQKIPNQDIRQDFKHAGNLFIVRDIHGDEVGFYAYKDVDPVELGFSGEVN